MTTEIMIVVNGIKTYRTIDESQIVFRTEPPPSIPDTEWPIWARMLKLLSKPEDKGLGDTIYRTIGSENSEAFKAWYKKTFGVDCGCTGRQAYLNNQYPL